MSVRTNDATTLTILDRAYDALLQSAHDGDTAPSQAVVRSDGNALQLVFNGAPAPYAYACSDDGFIRAYHATQELFARFAASLPGMLPLYGAAISIHGHAVLLLGPSGIGKSVFALHLVNLGAHFLGDETAVLDSATYCIRALPRRPLLREPALALLSDDLQRSVRAARNVHVTDEGRVWYALEPDNLLGIEPDGNAYPLRAIVTLRRSEPSPTICRIDTNEVFQTCALRTYGALSTLERASKLRAAISKSVCFDLSVGDPAAAAALLLETLHS